MKAFEGKILRLDLSHFSVLCEDFNGYKELIDECIGKINDNMAINAHNKIFGE